MTDYLTSGRTTQKRRTRTRLLQAARELLRQSKSPTVSEVADLAGVSRRTAYRYFPTQEQLLAEAALEAARAALSDLPLPAAVEERVDRMVGHVQKFVYENESALRTLTRLFLYTPLRGPRRRPTVDLPVRAHRLRNIEAALAPIRRQLSRREYDRLVSALTLCVGVEAALVLRYLSGLSPKDATDTCRWAARQLLLGALKEASEHRKHKRLRR